MKTNRIKKIQGILRVTVGVLLASLWIQGAVQASASPLFKVQYFDDTNAPNFVYQFNPTVQSTSNKQLVCEMIYVFDAHEEMQECCGCPTTNNGLRWMSVPANLTANPLTVPGPVNGVIKVVTTTINSSTTFAPCNPALLTSTSPILFPSPAWVSHIEKVALPTGSVNRGTEHDFEIAPLGLAELNSLASSCSTIHTQGSGRGICTCGGGDSVAATPGAGTR